LYRLLLKDALDPSDIRPYQELDLNRHGVEQGETALDPDSASPTVLEPEPAPVDLGALAPLLCLTAAQEKGAAILAEARREAEKLREEAHAEGKARGEEEAKQEILPALVSFADAGQSLIVFEERMVARFTPEMVRLALEIAEKILGKAVAEDPEIVASVLERAKREVPDARWLRVRLHPADCRLLAELRPELVRAGQEGGRKIEVVASDEVGRGGCRIETEIGIIDATIPTQLEEIKRQLLDE